MRVCFVPDCNHNTKKNQCKFTVFPKTPSRKSRWLVAIARADKLPIKTSYVCSCHFQDGIKGINSRKTPTIFRRDPAHQHLFSPPKRKLRKKVLEFVEPDVMNAVGDTSSSFSSSILSASLCHPDNSSTFEDLGVSALGSKSNAGVRLDDTLEDCPTSYRTPSSTPNPSGAKAPQSLTPHDTTSDPTGFPTTPLCRKASLRNQFISTSHPSGWNISDAESVSFHVPQKTKGTQTKVNTTESVTQCLISARGYEYVDGASQTCPPPTSTDSGAQTSTIMFDNADNFVSLGDNLSIVKSLLGDVMEARGKLINAEVKIKALVAERSSLQGQLEKCKTESDRKEKDMEKIKEKSDANAVKCSTLLRREKELFESLQEEKGRLLFRSISILDARVAHFTGLPNVQIFDYLCSHFTMPLHYHYNWTVTGLSREDQLFMTLMKLKCNYDYLDLALWFNVGETTVANVFLTFLDALHRVIFLEALKTVPSRAKNRRSLLQCFKGFEDCRMIIDCTEVRTVQPKSLAMKNIVYSGYKSCDTLKGLIGIAPNGAMTYASALFPGSTSDRKLIEMCGLLDIFEPGDLVLAGKGFTIRNLLGPLGVDINIPPFLDNPPFTPDQVGRTKGVARARIHVKRAIQRVKEYSILDMVPNQLCDISTKIFQVCAALTNFHNPLIKEGEDEMSSLTIDWDNMENEFDSVCWQ